MSEQEIREAVAGLRRGDPAALLVVQVIDTDPHADEATIALDWVDLFDGDQPGLRVQPREPSGWERMDRDLIDAAASLENVADNSREHDHLCGNDDPHRTATATAAALVLAVPGVLGAIEREHRVRRRAIRRE